MSRIPEDLKENSDEKEDHDKTPYTQKSLRKKAVNYFVEIRKPRHEWKNIHDLTPQMAEFDLRCKNEEYGAAAEIVTDIYIDYLNAWGAHHKVVHMLNPIKEKITDNGIKVRCLVRLGTSFQEIGETQKSIEVLKKSWKIAEEQNDEEWKATIQSVLGRCYMDLGQIDKAIEYFEQSIGVFKDENEAFAEGVNNTDLGIGYLDLGQTDKAIEYFEQSIPKLKEVNIHRHLQKVFYYLALAYMFKKNILKHTLRLLNPQNMIIIYSIIVF